MTYFVDYGLEVPYSHAHTCVHVHVHVHTCMGAHACARAHTHTAESLSVSTESTDRVIKNTTLLYITESQLSLLHLLAI